MTPDADEVLGDPLEPSPVYLREGERRALLKVALDEELSPSEPLRSNINRVQFGTKGRDFVLLKMGGFTDSMADRLSGIEMVDGWHVSPRASEYDGVDLYVEVGTDAE